MIRANASRCSHAELDEAETLDDGDPEELGREYAEIRGGCLRSMSWVDVVGPMCVM